MIVSIYKKALVLLSVLMAWSAAYALNIDEIRNSGNYYWGEGTAGDAKTADLNALEMMASQISVTVSSHTHLVNRSAEQRRNGKQEKDENSDYLSVINTFSNATFEESESLVLEQGTNTRIIRYIEKQEVYKIFQERRKRIEELMENVDRQLDLGKVDIALKNLSWAYALLRSMPGTSSETWRGHLLVTYIPQRIDEILDDIKVAIVNRENNDFDLSFTYKNRPASSLDYYTIEGSYPGPMCAAGDGRGEVSLVETSPVDRFELEIEYLYADQASDPEMQGVLRGTQPYRSKRASHIVKTSEDAPIKPTPINEQTASAQYDMPTTEPMEPPAPRSGTSSSMDSFIPAVEVANERAMRILRAISAKERPSALTEYFTPEALKRYNAIIRSGNAKIMDASKIDFTQSPGGNLICRGALLSFHYRTGKYRSFSRDIVFTFNDENLISNLSLGLGEAPRNDILNENTIPAPVRQAIVQFIENYQTAFALKDSTYLRNIFDDNAIIITGTVARQGMSKDDYMYRNDQRIIYNRYNKDQYLTRLCSIFRSREYVNVRFNNIAVVCINEEAQVYGIRLEQDYFTPTYNDQGYLYLQFKMSDPANPVIHVRTWQPNSVDIREIFNHNDFPIIG